MYSEKALKSFGRPLSQDWFLKVSRPGVAKKKVIRVRATGSMDRKFGNHEIFQNIDAGEGLRPLKSRNSLAGAISLPCGALTYHFFVLQRPTVILSEIEIQTPADTTIFKC